MDPIAESAPAVAPTVCCSRWTDMWNRLVPAAEVVAMDCRVYFGRTPQTARPTATTGPRELQSVIDGIWERLPGIRYRVDSPPRYQADSIARAGSCVRTAGSMKYLIGGAVRTLTTLAERPKPDNPQMLSGV
jgi:hypothetical protein